MKPIVIVIISIIAILVLAYIVFVLIVGRKMFIRLKKEILLTDVPNLEETHYKPYVDIVRDSMNKFMAIPYEEVCIRSLDKKRLYGKYYNNNSNETIIFIHGYHADSYNNASLIGLKLLEEGYNILLITNRSHGKSEGKFITFGIKESSDALLWIDFVNKAYGPDSIGLWGVSMGCSIIEMISDRLPLNCKAMVLDCGFTGAYEEVLFSLKRKLGFFGNVLMPGICLYTALVGHFKLKKSTAKNALANTNVPALFIHGFQDKLVPYNMGDDNYNSCQSEKDMISTDCGHAISQFAAKEEIEERVYPFLKMYLK